MSEERPTSRQPGRGGSGGDRLARRKPAAQHKAVEVATTSLTPARRARPTAPSARRTALDVLGRVLGDAGQPFDEAFASHPALERLAPRDRAFARILVTTVLRRLGQIDDIVLPHLRFRPRSRTVLDMLRLGAAQLLFLGTPAHAAVAETVRLAMTAHAREAPLVNAVLRKVAVDGAALLASQDAARLNTPVWLLASWEAAYGTETAAAIATAHLVEPALDLSVKAEPERWAGELGAELLPTGTLRRRRGGIVEVLPGFEAGAWWVQDAAAALPARLFRQLRGRRVLDLGAAPGGKTAQLCVAGAAVTAIERSPRRAQFLAGNLARLDLHAEIVVADANLWRPETPFDAVLLDAPCTATGTIRRHPDIPRLKSPADVGRLAEAQDRLLLSAVELVRPGGTIVYAVCSLQAEEGPARISAALERGLPLARDPIGRAELAGLAVDLTPEGDVRTLPSHLAAQGGIDGFFITRLRRTAA